MSAKFAALVCGLLLAPLAEPAPAAVGDPAVAQVQTLTAALLKSMRAGPAQSMAERYRSLAPVIEQVFAVALVARLSVGPDWTGFSPDQQQNVIAAFRRYTIANYAYNFRDFDGQKFEVDDHAATRGADRIVRTQIIPTHDVPVSLLYRLREVDGIWKIIDVYSNGISQLVLRRTDFVAAIAAGGAPVLIAHLNKVSDDFLKK